MDTIESSICSYNYLCLIPHFNFHDSTFIGYIKNYWDFRSTYIDYLHIRRPHITTYEWVWVRFLVQHTLLNITYIIDTSFGKNQDKLCIYGLNPNIFHIDFIDM